MTDRRTILFSDTDSGERETRASSVQFPFSSVSVTAYSPSGRMQARFPRSRYTGRQMPVPVYQRELGKAPPNTFTRIFRVPFRRWGVRSARKETYP